MWWRKIASYNTFESKDVRDNSKIGVEYFVQKPKKNVDKKLMLSIEWAPGTNEYKNSYNLDLAKRLSQNCWVYVSLFTNKGLYFKNNEDEVLSVVPYSLKQDVLNKCAWRNHLQEKWFDKVITISSSLNNTPYSIANNHLSNDTTKNDILIALSAASLWNQTFDAYRKIATMLWIEWWANATNKAIIDWYCDFNSLLVSEEDRLILAGESEKSKSKEEYLWYVENMIIDKLFVIYNEKDILFPEELKTSYRSIKTQSRNGDFNYLVPFQCNPLDPVQKILHHNMWDREESQTQAIEDIIKSYWLKRNT